MKVAIVGTGKLAQAIHRELQHRQVESSMHSRSNGFDVLDPSKSMSLGKADIVVEATGITTQSAEKAKAFFTQSTRRVNSAAAEAGASKHILVSILGCSRPDLRGNGYYAGKAEQERVALAEHANLALVRTTQWHEFARQMFDQMRFGPFSLIPSMTVQPIALANVAEVVADCATGERNDTQLDLAGPEVTTLLEMVKLLPNKGALPVPLRVPGKAGRAFRGGSLLPGDDATILGPTYGEWLAARAVP